MGRAEVEESGKEGREEGGVGCDDGGGGREEEEGSFGLVVAVDLRGRTNPPCTG